MQQQGGGNTKIVIVGVIVVIVAVVVIFVGVSLLNQPSLPPASSTPTPVTTPTTTTPTTPTPTTPTTTTPTTSPGTTSDDDEDDDDIVQTQGGVLEGVITNIYGGDQDPDGIGSSKGEGGRCVNLQGTAGYCTPEDGEEVHVYVCPAQTGIRCQTKDGGELLDDGLTTKVEVSDYVEDGCTIQLNVVIEGEDPEENPDALLDFIVFQLDECDGDVVSTGGLAAGGGTTSGGGALAECGDVCMYDDECPEGNVCSVAEGLCILEECSVDPTACEEGDPCTLAEIQATEGGAACGSTCVSTADCAIGTECVNEICTAVECLSASPPGCVGGCVVEAKPCGADCTDTSECGADHTCLNNKCIANFCIDDAGQLKCETGCELPKTAIISDELDIVLFGIIILLIGVIVMKTNLHVELFYALGGRAITAEFSDSEKEKLEKEIAEHKDRQRKMENEKAKKTREEFEQAMLAERDFDS